MYGAGRIAPQYFVQVLPRGLGSRRVTVDSVIPGATHTAEVFTERGDHDPTVRELTSRTRLGQRGARVDTANVVAHLVGDKAESIPGQHFTVDGGAAIR